jgi:hypothetical protein
VTTNQVKRSSRFMAALSASSRRATCKR